MLFLGVPVAISIGLSAFIGFWMVLGLDPAVARLGQVSYHALMNYAFSPIILFILMGEIIIFSGIGSDIFEATSKWVGKLPGGLAIASVLASALFGAICGVSIAGAATIGRLAIPEMLKRKYSRSLAAGTVAAGGTLSIMIPPSLAFILYGVVSEQSIGRLFIAGIIPGVLISLLYSGYVLLTATRHPENAPRMPSASWHEKLAAAKVIFPVAALFVMVLGTIYLGFGTPSEAGAMGATGALILALIYRKLSPGNLATACFQSAMTIGSIMIIAVAALFFGYYLATSGYSAKLIAAVSTAPVSRWVIMILINLLLLVLGCFLDVSAIILLTTPILLPTVIALGFDPIWYGVILVINIEMAFITPPVGLNLFVIRSLAPDIPISDVIRGAFPFVIIDVIAIAIIMLFPQLALWLPNTIMSYLG